MYTYILAGLQSGNIRRVAHNRLSATFEDNKVRLDHYAPNVPRLTVWFADGRTVAMNPVPLQQSHKSNVIHINYNKVLQRFAQYLETEKTDLMSLVREISYTIRKPVSDRVSQANTEGSQCRLDNGDKVYNFVTGVYIERGLAGLHPHGAHLDEIVDEIFIGDIPLAVLLELATDAQWDRVVRRPLNHRINAIRQAVPNRQVPCLRIMLEIDGNRFIHGLVRTWTADRHIEDALRLAPAGAYQFFAHDGSIYEPYTAILP